MATTGRRPLNRLERALAYGVLGWAGEVVFTSVRDALSAERRDWRLQGHSYLWMFPIYGLIAYLFEPLHDLVRDKPVWQRATAYASGFIAVEFATGTALRRAVGVVPWDYTGHGRLVVPGGAARIDYAPVWAGVGLVLERVHDTMRDLPARASR